MRQTDADQVACKGGGCCKKQSEQHIRIIRALKSVQDDARRDKVQNYIGHSCSDSIVEEPPFTGGKSHEYQNKKNNDLFAYSENILKHNRVLLS